MTDNEIKNPMKSLLFLLNMSFKKIFQYLTKVSGGFELEICGSQNQCPRQLRYDDIQESRPILAISQNI